MTVFERRALLRLHNLTLAQLSRETGRAAATIGTIINCYPKKKSREIQEYIAKRTKTPYARIWGTIAPKRVVKKKG
jgi:lambda repressor-like predicted transcriptional regulator